MVMCPGKGAVPGRGWCLLELITVDVQWGAEFLASFKDHGRSSLQHKDPWSTKGETGSVSRALLAVLAHGVSSFCWRFLHQCCSLNSLGRFTWSQDSSLHVQSWWRVATSHADKQTGLFVPRRPGFPGMEVAGGPGPSVPEASDGRTSFDGTPQSPPFLRATHAAPGAEGLRLACSGWESQPPVPLSSVQLSLLLGYGKKQTKAKCVGCWWFEIHCGERGINLPLDGSPKACLRLPATQHRAETEGGLTPVGVISAWMHLGLILLSQEPWFLGSRLWENGSSQNAVFSVSPTAVSADADSACPRQSPHAQESRRPALTRRGYCQRIGLRWNFYFEPWRMIRLSSSESRSEDGSVENPWNPWTSQKGA